MATHFLNTPAPIVDLTTPRKQVEDALYDAGVITDIVGRLANADISLAEQTCPTAYAWLAKELSACHERIELAVSRIGRGR